MPFNPKNLGASFFAAQPAPAVVGVAAFGKHPAYADHLPLDVGDQSPLSARLRQTLYNGGILTRVGEFDALQKAGKAIPFGHFILYHEPDGAAAGGGEGTALVRLWPSKDSVNRSDIPMILAACGSGVDPGWILKNGADVLTTAQPRCMAAKTLEELTAAVTSATAELRSRIPTPEAAAAGGAADGLPLPALAAGPDFVAGLRAIRDYLPMDGPSKFSMPDRPAVARVTPLGSTVLQSLAAWSHVLDAALQGRKVRYFLIAPDSGQWVDLLLGDPAGKHFICVRSGLAALTAVTPAADELTDSFGRAAVAWLKKLAETSQPPPLAAPPAPPPPPTPIAIEAPPTAAPPPPPPATPPATPPARSAPAALPPAAGGMPVKLIGAAAAVVVAALGVGGYLLFHLGGTSHQQTAAINPPPPSAAAAPVAPSPAPVAVAPASPTPPPAPAPATPPAPLDEVDPRSNWDLATLKQDLAAAAANVAAINQLKTAFADVPGVNGAVKDAPDVSAIRAAVADIDTAQWPRDKSLIQRRKHDLDAAKAHLDWVNLKSPDYPKAAWAAALGALQKVKFQSADLQQRWDKLTADPRLAKEYAPDQFPVAPPEVYRRLAALDKEITASATAAVGPDALAPVLQAAMTDKTATVQSISDSYHELTQQAQEAVAATAAAKVAVRQADALLDHPDPTPAKLNMAIARFSAIKTSDLAPADAQALDQRRGEILALLQPANLQAAHPARDIAQARTVATAVALWRNWVSAGPQGRPLDDDALVNAAIRARCADASLAREIDDAARARWVARFDALWTAAPADDPTPEIQALVHAAQAAQVSDPGAVLTGVNRANWQLYQFKLRMAAAQTDDQATAAARQFLADLGQSPPPPLAAVAGQISVALTPPPAPGQAYGPEGRPGVTRVAGDRDSAVVKYNCMGTTLSFVRLGNAYFGADEFPVGLFVTIVNQQKWDPEKDLDLRLSYIYPKDDHGVVRPKLIPRSWEWNADQARMELHAAWITTGDSSEDAYVNADKGDPVTADSPLQYVSPELAVKLAQFLGCRLPTVGEWQAATRPAPIGSSALRVNSADQAAYLTPLAKLDAKPPTKYLLEYSPDPNVAPSPGMPARVWFSPVKGDSDTLRDLVGNLSEYVIPAADSDALGADVKIAGASAWSPDSVKSDALRDTGPLKSHAHFADVGFRLAFSAPPTPPSAKLRQIAARAAYQSVAQIP